MTSTGSPGQGGASHIWTSTGAMLGGSFFWSTDKRLKSTSSNDPCFKTVAGKTPPAILTLMRASTEVRCAAVITNPDLRYMPEPDWAPSTKIPTATAEGNAL